MPVTTGCRSDWVFISRHCCTAKKKGQASRLALFYAHWPIFYRCSAVAVTVVQIGIVRMFVVHRLMAMPMRMRFAHRPIVIVLVMKVMGMRVLVFQRLVQMVVLVPLR